VDTIYDEWMRHFEEKMEAKEEGHDAPLNPFLKFANFRASWRNGR